MSIARCPKTKMVRLIIIIIIIITIIIITIIIITILLVVLPRDGSSPTIK